MSEELNNVLIVIISNHFDGLINKYEDELDKLIDYDYTHYEDIKEVENRIKETKILKEIVIKELKNKENLEEKIEDLEKRIERINDTLSHHNITVDFID